MTMATTMCSVALDAVRGQRNRNFYIQLAKESPSHNSELSDNDDDDLAYDSVHGKETDVCRDTSDTESNTDSDSSYTTEAEGIATMEVVEYEVAGCSDSIFFTDDSTSGTDDEIIFATLERNLHDESTDVTYRSDSDSDSGSAVTDPELKKADYWKCVKCKNKQNNPMYRYCEKCYQLRKTHFPPRPTFRKSRASPSSTNGTSSTDFNRRNRPNKRKRRFSSVSPTPSTLSTSPKTMRTQSDGSEALAHTYTSDASSIASTPTSRNSRSRKNSCSWSVSTSGSNKSRNLRSRYHMATDSDSSSDATLFSDGGNSDFSRLNSSRRNKKSTKQKRALSRLEEMAEDSHPTSPLLSEMSCTINSHKLDDKNSSLSTIQASSRKRRHSSDVSEAEVEKIKSHQTGQSQSEDLVENECDIKRRRKVEPPSVLNLQASSSTSSKDSGFSSCNSQEYSIGGKDSDYSPDAAFVSKSIPKSDSAMSQESMLSQESFASSCLSSGDNIKLNIVQNLKNNGDNNDGNGQDITSGLCIMCLSAPKNGAFVHSRFLHLCCCYRCAVKCWKQRKQCPICNCKISKVLKLYVH